MSSDTYDETSEYGCFDVDILFELKDGKHIYYNGFGVPEKDEEFYIGQLYLEVSPKQLGECDSIQEMIELLKGSVYCKVNHGQSIKKIFDAEDPLVKQIVNTDVEIENTKLFNYKFNHSFALDFINKIRSLNSVNEINSIKICGTEIHRIDYTITYKYDLTTEEYTLETEGEKYYEEGAPGGCLNFADSSEARYIKEIPKRKKKKLIAKNDAIFGKEGIIKTCDWLRFKYENPIIEELVKKYNYKNEWFNYCDVEDLFTEFEGKKDIFYFEDDPMGPIFPYYGVNTIDNLTKSLLSLLFVCGTSDNGFKEALISEKERISRNFVSFKGKFAVCNDYENINCTTHIVKMEGELFDYKAIDIKGGW